MEVFFLATDIVTAILSVFGDISEWLVIQLGNVTDLFWMQQADSYSLTFLGVLGVMALGISVVFVMIRVIQNFLHFRG